MSIVSKIISFMIGFYILSSDLVFGQQVYSDKEYYEEMIDYKSVRAKSKFKFRKKRYTKNIDFNKIDTNAVYITMYSDSMFSFKRFFKDAVFESGPYKTNPSILELENLIYGVWRCYTINKKGLIIIEEPKRFEMDSRWTYYYGNVTNDKVELTHYYMSYPPFWSSPGRLQTPWVFHKQPVEFQNRKYEWK